MNESDKWKEAVNSVYKRFNFDSINPYMKIHENWSLIVKDEVLCQYCRPKKIIEDILYVEADNSMARSALLSIKSRIIQNIGIVCPKAGIIDIRISGK